MHLFHKNMGRLCEKHEKRKKGESVRTTNGHEWTRKAGVNHEKHEIHEKRRQGRVRTTNGHEWQG